MPSPLPVLFTHYGEDWIRGSENVLLDLLRHLDRARIAPVVWCNAPAMEAACRDLGLPTHRSDFAIHFDYPDSSAPFSPRGYAARVREAVALIRRHGIRVLHANSAAPTQWLAPAAAWTRRPLLTHLHIGYMRRSRYAMLLHQADRVVGVAAHVTAPLLADGLPPSRRLTIPNGVAPERLGAEGPGLRAALGIPDSALVVASVGSLIRRKGHDVLLRALAAAPAGPEVHLLLAGSGEAEAELRALANGLGLSSSRVHWLGAVAEPGPVYAACDVFALASRFESFGLVFAEAGWWGKPSIGTRMPGVDEVVAEGETGLLVPVEDVAGLAAAIGRLAADPALRQRMGAAARRRVEAQFLAAGMAARFTEAYAALAAEGRGASLGWPRLRPWVRLLAGRAGRP